MLLLPDRIPDIKAPLVTRTLHSFIVTLSPSSGSALLRILLDPLEICPFDMVCITIVIPEVPSVAGILRDLFTSFILQVLLPTSIRSASASLFKHIKAPFNYNATGDVGTAPTYSGSKPDSLLLG